MFDGADRETEERILSALCSIETLFNALSELRSAPDLNAAAVTLLAVLGRVLEKGR